MSTYLVLNWKMHPATEKEAKKLFTLTKTLTEKRKDLHTVVAPPSVFLRALREGYGGKKLTFAAQSGRAETTGAYTGSISLAQTYDAGARYAIIGHAERRAAGETNEDTRAQVSVAYTLGMTPILCIGERERSAENAHLAFIREQIRAGLTDVPQTKISNLVIAYEPVWAIGAKESMVPHQMHEMAVFIRKTLNDLYGPRAMNTPILYGGSIDELSAADMLTLGDVRGLLVGRASVDAVKLAALIEHIPHLT